MQGNLFESLFEVAEAVQFDNFKSAMKARLCSPGIRSSVRGFAITLYHESAPDECQ